MYKERRKFNSTYYGEYLNRVAFPLGGTGAGMICMEGTGALSQFSLRHAPNVFFKPCVFSAISIKRNHSNIVRVLEGPVPKWRIFGNPNTGLGVGETSIGLPRFQEATFNMCFPFGKVMFYDEKVPLKVEMIGWSPFILRDEDNTSLPVAGIEYTFINPTDEPIDAVYSFHSKNFMKMNSGKDAILPIENGFILFEMGSKDKPWEKGAFCARVHEDKAYINHAWFRGGWWDPLTMAWKDVEEGRYFYRPPIESGESSIGASLFIPIRVQPGEMKKVKVMLSWYVPETNLRTGPAPDIHDDTDKKGKISYHKPWYSVRFKDIRDVSNYFKEKYDYLFEKTKLFSDSFYDTTLPDEVVEAVAANLCILKSPTFLREPDGRLWGWEGCADSNGSCPGNCTHVYNYAQAIAHLFPVFDRSILQTEYNEDLSDEGRQAFRAELPIRPSIFDDEAACDGQLGSIMRVYRHWRITGDTDWLSEMWPKVKRSMDFCISHWDPRHRGVLEEPHHNTYDVEFWGPDGMSTSIYLGALKAVIVMAKELGQDFCFYSSLLEKGIKYMDEELYNGEYYYQKVEWRNLNSVSPLEYKSWWGYSYTSEEGRELFEKEGPKYQYGEGCLSDGILGAWFAEVCGVKKFLDPQKIKKNLQSIYKYNFKQDLSEHSNTQRPGYALGKEGGLLLCTWPKGNEATLPFPYSNEVWTGIEYQVASHLIMEGMVEEGLAIVRACRRRYSGDVRNPFNEYECGHWYVRALSSYALLQSLTGVRYDAVEKTLYITPRIKGDFRTFFSASTWYGTVGVRDGKPYYEVKDGFCDVLNIVYKKFE